MPKLLGWDRFETALLIDACERVTNGSPKQEIVKDLSAKLRLRAISRGQEIDELFRNENGVALQMTKMDYLLTNGKKGLPGASKSFTEMVALKQSAPTEFLLILKSAKQQINEERSESKKMEDNRIAFQEWINSQPKTQVHPNAIFSTIAESSDYVLQHGLSKKSFWEIDDSETFVALYRKLSGNRFFRVSKKLTAQKLDKVYVYYRKYLETLNVKEETVLNNDTLLDSSKSTDIQDSKIANKLYSDVYETLEKLSKESTYGVSVLGIQRVIGGKFQEIKDILDRADWAKENGKFYKLTHPATERPTKIIDKADGVLTVDFNESISLSFTKPVTFSYLGHKYTGIKSWTDLYVSLFSLIYNEYKEKSNIFHDVILGVSFSDRKSSRIDLACGESAKSMRAPKQLIANEEIFLETNLSATNIVDKIRYILNFLKIPYQNVVINYERNSDSSKSYNGKNEDDVINSDELMVGFSDWLRNKGMAEATVRGYISSIRSAQQYAIHNVLEGVTLTSSDTSEILRSIDILLANKAFFKYNREQHNRFSSAFRKLRDYTTELNRKNEQKSNDVALEMLYPELYHKLYSVSKIYDDPQGLTLDHIASIVGILDEISLRNNIIEILDGASWATKIADNVYSFSKKLIVQVPVVEGPIVENVETSDFDKEAFTRVLMSRYQSGMQFDSIDLENFRDTYEDMYDEKLTFSDEELEGRLKCCGILYKDRLFPAEGIIDNGTKERLFAYIENKFAAGNKVLYYKAIFSDLADAFAYCFSLTDEQMLKAYIEHTAEKGKYYFHSNFMSTEKNVKIDHSAEIEDFMLAAGKPLSYDEIYAGLSHISKDIIYREIRSGSNFLMNAKECYFHINIFEFSDSDGDRIAGIFNKEIDENGYVIWSKVYDSVKEQMPFFIENNLYLSPLGIRNALSRLMADRFDFDGEVISTHGSHLGMADVFRLYAKHNTPFSDTDLYTFAKATDTTIYFSALAEESVRVSKNIFVAKDQVEFDVDATDKALETYLSSGYILVKDVDSFLVFPNVGYEWNEFLLESYLLHYSKKFCLVNNGTSLNNVAGAVAKKDGNYTQFVDICAQALADSGIELKKTVALNYLAEINLITRRSYKELDIAMTKARQIRNRKG